MRIAMAAGFLFVLLAAAAPASADRFSSVVTGTVTDSHSGLMWQQPAGSQTQAWSAALLYCEGLTLGGFLDWRVPDIKELRSLVDDTSFDMTVFAGTPQGGFWSSTSRAGSPNFAWYVAFTSGVVYTDLKTSSIYVRCVR